MEGGGGINRLYHRIVFLYFNVDGNLCQRIVITYFTVQMVIYAIALYLPTYFKWMVISIGLSVSSKSIFYDT